MKPFEPQRMQIDDADFQLTKAISKGLLIVGAVAAVTTLFAIVWSYFPIFHGDYEQIFRRATQLKHHEISAYDFVFRRQIDHPHFLVFALAYVDTFALGGYGYLLYGAMAAFSAVALLVLVTSARSSVPDSHAQSALIGVGIFLLFGPQNVGVLSLPFQVTLIGTASLVFAGSYLLTSSGSLPRTIAATVALGVGVISHGAGVLSLPILAAYGLFKRQPRYLIVAAILAGEFALYSASYPATPQIGMGALFLKAVHAPLDWIAIPLYIAYLLGRGITQAHLGPVTDVLVGTVGLVMFAAILLRTTRKPKAGDHWLLMATFGLVACAISVTLNIAYSDLRHPTSGLSYYFADRYLPWIAFFWLGTLCSVVTNWPTQKNVAIIASALIAMALLVGSFSTLQRLSVNREAREDLILNFGCQTKLSACTISHAVGLPPLHARQWSSDVFDWQRQVGAFHIKSPAACSGGATWPAKRHSSDEKTITLQAVDFSDANWERGILRARAGFFVQDPTGVSELHECDTVKFADGTTREITAIDGRNVYLDGEALDPKTTGFPARIEVTAFAPLDP